VHPASLLLVVQHSCGGGVRRFLARLTFAQFADQALGETGLHGEACPLDGFLSLTP